MNDIVDMQLIFSLPLDNNMEGYNKRIAEANIKLKEHLLWEHLEKPIEREAEILDLAHYHHMKHSFWPSQFGHDINWWGVTEIYVSSNC